ncbi:hypothetical protein C0995_001642 [Termitomyces sp. Mi166|nr:hypothetical protein C0995_001642 [Termitomyces sp. Mi166\
MSTGFALFQSAETRYYQGKIPSAFEFYQKSIKKILKDENLVAKTPLPPGTQVPDDMPQELLGMVWRNFVGFFRDPKMDFTEENSPEAYKLLNSFRPSATRGHPRLERTERGRVLLKGMQITAALTLGLLAWDKRDRATAAKRYREGIELANTHQTFVKLPPGTKGWELWVHHDLQDVKDNLGIIVANDEINAGIVKETSGEEPKKREVVDLPLPQIRVDKAGAATVEDTVKFATNACATCGKRNMKLLTATLTVKGQIGSTLDAVSFKKPKTNTRHSENTKLAVSKKLEKGKKSGNRIER